MNALPKLLHHHIPKTGGTSLNKMLDSIFNTHKVFPNIDGNDVINFVPSLDGILKAAGNQDDWSASDLARGDAHAVGCSNLFKEYNLIYGHFNLIKHAPDDWMVITVIRDPIHRMVSLYNDWRSLTERNLRAYHENHPVKEVKIAARTMDILSFIKERAAGDDAHPAVRKDFINGMCKSLIGDSLFSYPNAKELNSLSVEELFAAAKKVCERVNLIGTTDKFSQFTQKLSQRLNLDEPLKELDLNKGAEKIKVAKRLGRKVYEWNHDDLIEFNEADIMLYDHITQSSHTPHESSPSRP